MWSEATAQAVRREVAALSVVDVPVHELQNLRAELLDRVVPHDASCFGTCDPGNGMVTSTVSRGFAPDAEEQARYAELEITGAHADTFQRLATARHPVSRLSDAAGGARSTARWNDLYRPIGFAFELRAALRDDAGLWGVAELYRAPGSRDFDDRELEFVASVVGPVAAALRRAALAPAESTALVEQGPAVLVVEAGGALRAATPAAEEWTERARGADAEGFGMALHSVVAVVAAGATSARARCRVDGRWVAVSASPLVGDGTGAVVATIEPASSTEVSGLLLAAHGLTERERDVCVQVLAGRSTRDIAEALFISAHTVQDHLKSVFAKVGVRSRRELVAALRPDA